MSTGSRQTPTGVLVDEAWVASERATFTSDEAYLETLRNRARVFAEAAIGFQIDLTFAETVIIGGVRVLRGSWISRGRMAVSA